MTQDLSRPVGALTGRVPQAKFHQLVVNVDVVDVVFEHGGFTVRYMKLGIGRARSISNSLYLGKEAPGENVE